MEQIKWFLKDLKKPSHDAPKVFSCFHCGGGSTMGYKLAGFNVLGGVEIDPKMMEVYRKNFNPKYSYLMGVQDFKNIPDSELPKELFNLDILDGSPPCSSFSTAGSREEAWGKKKKFREGQANQVLDELFFDFINIAKKLNPKIVVAENVSGLIKGNAKFYVKRIVKAFNEAGYDVQLFLLNAAFMGVPQKRERTFFIAKRKDLALEKIELDFNLDPISIAQATMDLVNKEEYLTPSQLEYWNKCKPGEKFSKYHPKGYRFGQAKVDPKMPCNTLVTKTDTFFHWLYKRSLDVNEWRRIGTFPEDYQDLKQYIIGMSVPPKMMEKVALQIKRQWLCGNKKKTKLRKNK